LLDSGAQKSANERCPFHPIFEYPVFTDWRAKSVQRRDPDFQLAMA
jgi:hypothetical protein